jgi:hypothetical protein
MLDHCLAPVCVSNGSLCLARGKAVKGVRVNSRMLFSLVKSA